MSRTSFWILLPFLIIFVGGMLWVDIFTGAIGSFGGRAFVAGMCVVVGALGLAFYDLDRFWWAGRIVATFVFLVYIAYIIDEWFFSGHSWKYALGSHSATSPINAILGMIAYGVPAFCYIFYGRFHWRKRINTEEIYFQPDEAEENINEDEESENNAIKWYER